MAKTWTKKINGVEVSFVARQWHNIEKEILSQKVYKLTNGNITVYELTNGIENEAIQMGINWASVGTVSSNKAVAFAEKIITVSQLVENYKYNGYIVDYTNWNDFSKEEQEEIKAYAKEHGIA